MKPEIKAKVDEILKAHGMRELSLDDMDKVSGGWGSENYPHEIYLGGELYDEATFNSVILEVADSYGDDTALLFAQDLTGYPFVKANKTVSGDLRQTLKDFWYSVETGKYMGH